MRIRHVQILLWICILNTCQGWIHSSYTAAPPTTTTRPSLRRKQTSLSRCHFPSSSTTITRLSSSRGYSSAYDPNNYDNNEEEEEDDDEEELHVYVATCIPGLSKTLSKELYTLGAHAVETTGNAACRFQATLSTVLTMLIWARIPHKIMEFLCESDPTLQTRDDVYDFCRQRIPVAHVLGNGRGGLLTLCIVDTILNNPTRIPADINHSHYTALTIKAALCDAVRDKRGDRPSIDTTNPDVPLVAVLRGIPPPKSMSGSSPNKDNNNGAERVAQLSLYRQIHMGSLHRRGYRSSSSAIHKAALKESLAAGLLVEAGWPEQCQQHYQQTTTTTTTSTVASMTRPLVLVDPMAGSGSLVLEALFVAAHVAPHVLRLKCGMQPQSVHQYPPITRWKHDNKHEVQSRWKELLVDATHQAKNGLHWMRTPIMVRQEEDDDDESLSTPSIVTCPPVVLLANDIHAGSLDLLQEALDRASVSDLVQVTHSDCQDFLTRLDDDDDDSNNQAWSSVPWTVVCNPPWNVRLTEDVEDSWESLRFFLKSTCPPNTVAHVLSGNAALTKHLQLRRTASVPLQVGTANLRWITYPIQPPIPHDTTTTMTTTTTAVVPNHNQSQDRPRPTKDATPRKRSVQTTTQSKSAAAKQRERDLVENEWLID